jgi:hypothetical protein
VLLVVLAAAHCALARQRRVAAGPACAHHRGLLGLWRAAACCCPRGLRPPPRPASSEGIVRSSVASGKEEGFTGLSYSRMLPNHGVIFWSRSKQLISDTFIDQIDTVYMMKVVYTVTAFATLLICPCARQSSRKSAGSLAHTNLV